MGYTHYWNIPRPIGKKTWAKICADVRALFEKSPVALVGDEDDQASKPIASEREIRFNGAGDDAYETFLLERTGENGGAFCKTNRNFYDVMVCAVLIVAEKHAPRQIRVTSDGGMASFVDDYPGPHDSEWDVALQFVSETLSGDYKLPRLIEFRK